MWWNIIPWDIDIHRANAGNDRPFGVEGDRLDRHSSGFLPENVSQNIKKYTNTIVRPELIS